MFQEAQIYKREKDKGTTIPTEMQQATLCNVPGSTNLKKRKNRGTKIHTEMQQAALPRHPQSRYHPCPHRPTRLPHPPTPPPYPHAGTADEHLGSDLPRSKETGCEPWRGCLVRDQHR